jgi:hypothetical protein
VAVLADERRRMTTAKRRGLLYYYCSTAGGHAESHAALRVNASSHSVARDPTGITLSVYCIHQYMCFRI